MQFSIVQFLLMMMCIIGLYACGDEENTDSTSNEIEADTEAGAGAEAGTEAGAGAEAGTEVISNVVAQYIFSDYFLYINGVVSHLVNVELTYEDQTVTSNVDGLAEIELPPNQMFEVETNLAGFFPYHLFGKTCNGHCERTNNNTFKVIQPLVSIEAGVLLSDSLGITLGENNTGNVLIGVFTQDYDAAKDGEVYGLKPVVGAQVELSNAVVATLTEDSASPTGLSPGNTVVTGNLVFVNVEAGISTITLTVPEEYTKCSVYPSTQAHEGDVEITVYPNAASVIDFLCTTEE